MENTKTISKRQRLVYLCFCAAMIALGTVLSFAKIFELPLGGSVTLCSMLPVMLVSYFCGIKWGLVSSTIFASIQALISLGEVMSWGLSVSAVVACMLLDYILAYAILGIAGIFKKSGVSTASHCVRFALGMLIAVVIRFICHFISGVVLFSSWAAFEPAWVYSIVYNGSFLLPDLILCVIVGLAVFTPIRILFEKTAK